MQWKWLDTGANTAQANMDMDRDLLESLKHDPIPTFHVYDWIHPSLTYGYFTDPSKYLNLDKIDIHGIDHAKRPTGGGVTFHLTDLAFSVLIPANHPNYSTCIVKNYAYVNSAVLRALSSHTDTSLTLNNCEPTPTSHYCSAQATQYDILLRGKKVGGAAQRRTQHGILHQGTLHLKRPPRALLRSIIPNEEVLHAIDANSHYLLEDYPSDVLENSKRVILYHIFNELDKGFMYEQTQC